MRTYPIDGILSQLKEAVAGNPAVVLQAPPGAGKTTRVPLFLLDCIPPEQGSIVMLEPRRIAAVSAAKWMAQSLNEQAGETVGYAIRFDRKISGRTRVEVVTEGILTRRIQTDPALEGVAMVILDEFHERSIQADLALALCLDIQKNLREDLRILIMSATLDCVPLSSLLGAAPVLRSEGRIFPVEDRYVQDRSDRPAAERVAEVIGRALKETSGDILAFLPGAGEIRGCANRLRAAAGRSGGGITLHPLYGDLPFELQQQAILPSEKRKIVLATNIAETSLTIEGVRVVVDSGLTRRLRFDPVTGMNRLVTVSVSQASAEQRRGRAGRLGPGTCYRLYSRQAFAAMLPFTPPEILTSDLASLVLELSVWGTKDPKALTWLDLPPVSAWEAARDLLADLDAIDASGRPTPAGRAMARLPLHPRLGHLLLRAAELGSPELGADLSALLSERDLIRREALQSRGYSGRADIGEGLDMLKTWRKTKYLPPGVDLSALQIVGRTSKQLLRLITVDNRVSAQKPAGPDHISRLLLAAFPDRVAKLRDDGNGRFLLSQGRGVRLPTDSGLSRSAFIVAMDLDAGEGSEGLVYRAAPVTEEILREECGRRIKTIRRIAWDKGLERIEAVVEERIGAISLSIKPFTPSDEEAVPVLCEAIRSWPKMLNFSKEALQFMARVSLIRRTFPEEPWPELSLQALAADPGKWLPPRLGGIRSSRALSGLDLLPALRARLTWEQNRTLDERAPTQIRVPSGSRIQLDYCAGDTPVLSVKLQEMFGLADTPVIAEGRSKVLLQLLSPARRPVQMTQDLRGFWDSGYQMVKKELKGRYPKHPWPDDPWKAAPTRKAKPRGE
ncbi:MAG: ATP-dependent helicase HrpB [Nitrospirae bacterium]|nr:MAG: ATP-dependent helicase HrpB [Nitrospirota bacterium]